MIDKKMFRKTKYHKRIAIVACLLLLTTAGCKKFVDVTPPNTIINSGDVYASDANAIAAVTNIYVSMSTANLQSGSITSLSLFPAISSDELSLYSGATNNAVNYYYSNSLSATVVSAGNFWGSLYTIIYQANAAIAGISASDALTPAVKQQLLGEAEFVRAFCYFYLVNLYGDVPLALSPDYKVNATLSRSPQQSVYGQIISDLKAAQGQLGTNFLGASLLSVTSDRVRPTKWAAATSTMNRSWAVTGAANARRAPIPVDLAQRSLEGLIKKPPPKNF